MDELNKQNLEALFYKLGLDKKGSFDDFFNGMSVKENREAFFYKSGLDKKGTFDQFEQGIVINKPQKETEQEEDELDLGILNNTWVGNLIKNGKKAIQRGYEQGEAVNPSIELLYDANDASSEDIQDFVKQVNDQGRYQPSEEYKEWSNTDGWLNSAALLATKGHKILPEIILESASAFVRSAVTNPGAAGVGIGALSGVGAVYTVPALAFSVSSALETSGKFQESMQEELNKRGLKFDEDGIREVLSDPEAMSEIRSKAIIRGGVVGAIDALTAGLTGKIVGKALLKGSGKGVAALKGLGVESTGGAAGDALGSLAIGEKLHPASVLGEFFGEIGSPGAYINIYQGFKQDASKLQNTGKQGKVDAANQTVSSTRVSDPLSDKTIQSAAESVLMGDKTLFDEVLDQNVEVKAITSEESQQLKELYDELDEINATIPEEVNDINSRSQIITNIKKRKLIEDLLKAEEGKAVDVAFEESKKIKTNNLKNQIDELNIKIKKLAEPPSQKTTPKAAEKQDVSEKQPSEISTKVTTKESKITPDAEAFLNNLDQDGVPLIITNKLKKIGLNNGFSEKEIDAMTPNALIQGLKDKKEGKSKQPKNLTDYDKLTRTNELSDSSFSSKRSYTEPVSEIEIKEFDESNSVSNTRLEAIADKLIDIDSGRVNTPSLTDFESRVFDLKEKEINNILNSRKKQTPVKSVSKKEVTSREEISSEIGYDPLDLKTNTVLSNKATGSKLKIVRFEKTKSGRYNFFLSKMDSNGYNYGIPVIKDQDDITFWRNQEVLPDMSFKDKQNQKVEKGIAVSEKTRVRNNPQVEYSWEKADSENVRVGSIVKYDGETYRITDSKAGKFKLKQSDDSGEIIPNGNNVADVIAKDIDQVRGKFSKITNNFEYTVDDIADDIYDAFFAFQESDKSLGLEQARAIAVVYDALAKKLSKREGISPAAWWEKHLQSIHFSRFENFVKDYKKGALTQKQTNIALQYVNDQIEIYNKVIADPYTDERVIPELEAKVSELEKIRSKIENNDVSKELFQTMEQLTSQSTGQIAKGATTARLDNGKRLILAFESADVTTAVHELMHFITPFLNQNETSFILSEFNKTFPNKNTNKFNRNVHEWLAQSWEEYMRQGPQKIQNPLRDVLNKISDWFRGIYKNFILYNQDNKTVINLSPEMRDFFDQLLSDEEENVGNIVSNIQTELDGTFTQTGLSSKKDRDKFLKYLTTMVLSTNIPFDLLWENSKHYFSAKGFTKEDIQSIYDNNPDIKFHTSRFGFRAVQDKNLKKLPILDQIKTEFEVKSNIQTETQAERIISALQFVYPDDWINKAINIVSKYGYPIDLINNDGVAFSYTPTLTDRGVIGQKLVKMLTLEAKKNPSEANRYYGLISEMIDGVMSYANDVGRALQSFKLWSNMDADGFVYHAAKVLRRLDKKALEKYDVHIDTIIEGLDSAKRKAYDQTKAEFEDIDFDETLFQTQDVINKLAEIVKKRKNVTNDEAIKIARDVVNAYDKNFKNEYEKFRNGSSTFVRNLMKTADEITGSSMSRQQIEDMVRDKLNYKNKLSDEVIKNVVKMAKRLESIPEDSDLLKTQEVHKILEYISENVGKDVKEITGVVPEKMGWALWYASILSSTGTQILNTMANVFKAIFDNTFSSIYTYVNLKNVDGADRFRIALSNWNALLKQLTPYLQESKSRNEFKDILFKGYKSTNTSVKWFESAILEQRGNNLKFPTNLKEIENFSAYFAKLVPRIMSAVDGYFYWANYHARLRQIQMKSAYDTGLRGQALSDAVSDGIYGKKAKSLALQTAELELKPKGKFLLDANGNPFTDVDIRRRADEILEKDYVENWGTNEQAKLAVDFAQRATFTNEPEGFWGEISRAISRVHNSDNKILAYGSKIIVPFTRIVANVLDEQLQYAVVGSTTAVAKSLKKIPLSEVEHYKLQRGLAGLVFLVGGSIMAAAFAQNFGDDEDDPNKIRLWGEGPKDFNVRTQLAMSGWKPYTIQIGNTYISYKEYPIGLMMAFIGNMFDHIRFSKNADEEFGNKSQIEIALRLQFTQLIQSPETILNASFISGLSNFFENIILAAKEENPEAAMSKAVSYFTQQLGSSAPLIPVVGPIVTIPTSNLAKQAYKLMFDNRWLSSSDPDGFERAKKVFIRSLLGQPFFTDAEPYKTSLGDEIYNDKTGLVLRMVNFGKSDEVYDLLLNKNVYIPGMGFGTMIEGERIWDTNRDLFQELAEERGRLIKEYIYDNLELYQYMSREEILNDLQLNGLDSSKKNSFLKRAKRNLGY